MADSKRFKALVDALHNLIQQYNLDIELHRQPVSDSIFPSQVPPLPANYVKRPDHFTDMEASDFDQNEVADFVDEKGEILELFDD